MTPRRKIRAFVLFVLTCPIIMFWCLPLSACSSRLDFSAEFYYVCYSCPGDSLSASSISSLVSSYGGAGYIVLLDGKYYVTVAAYYNESDAQSVRDALAKKQLECEVVKAEREDFTLHRSEDISAEECLSALRTIYSLSVMCYDLANGLDRFTIDQAAAKSVLDSVRDSLEGLQRADSAGALGTDIARVGAECDDVMYGYILSKDVRRLQIILCDAIINVDLT